MRLLKIVAVPAAIALLLTPTDAAEARVRSKILGNIQKSNLSQAQKGTTLAQAETTKCPCGTPCHTKHTEYNGECPDGPQYNPADFKNREDLYKFADVKPTTQPGTTDPFFIVGDNPATWSPTNLDD